MLRRCSEGGVGIFLDTLQFGISDIFPKNNPKSEIGDSFLFGDRSGILSIKKSKPETY